MKWMSASLLVLVSLGCGATSREATAQRTLPAPEPRWGESGQAPAPRAWALVTEAIERILEAGRYLTRARTDRARAYRAFARPTPTRKRVAKKNTSGDNAPPASPTPG